MAKWTKDEEDVFAEFGIGEGELGLRKFIRGQRRINGKLYTAIDLILASLKRQRGKESDKNLEKAEKVNDVVPGEPPGCDKTGLGGAGSGGG
jgi:hypothetical protein